MAKTAEISFKFSPNRGETTVQEWVYRELREAILLGRIPPGRAMTIRGLAELLGVSAMPVREALRRLVAERALTLPDNRRARVPEMTAAKFEELVNARIALETLAAVRAMPMVDAKRLAFLRGIDERPLDQVHVAEMEDNIVRNYLFHRSLYESEPSQVLMSLIESVWLQLGPFMRLAMSHIGDHYPVDRHNEAIAAIERRDAIALRIAIEADIRDGIGHLGKAELLESYITRFKAA
ncbi:MAG: GntR family transcriptional regulator [Pseudomonadota bacterium]